MCVCICSSYLFSSLEDANTPLSSEYYQAKRWKVVVDTSSYHPDLRSEINNCFPSCFKQHRKVVLSCHFLGNNLLKAKPSCPGTYLLPGASCAMNDQCRTIKAQSLQLNSGQLWWTVQRWGPSLSLHCSQSFTSAQSCFLPLFFIDVIPQNIPW